MEPLQAPGVGIDLVEIERFRAVMERNGQRLLDRVFTPAEQRSCESRADPPVHYAARFAAKEAAMKALGTGWGQHGVGFLQFEIQSDGKTAPRLLLTGKAAELAGQAELRGMRVSLTHSETTAGAVVVADRS